MRVSWLRLNEAIAILDHDVQRARESLVRDQQGVAGRGPICGVDCTAGSVRRISLGLKADVEALKRHARLVPLTDMPTFLGQGREMLGTSGTRDVCFTLFLAEPARTPIRLVGAVRRPKRAISAFAGAVVALWFIAGIGARFSEKSALLNRRHPEGFSHELLPD